MIRQRTPATTSASPPDPRLDGELDRLRRRLDETRRCHIGFPGATDFDYTPLAGLLSTQLLNNVGDPYTDGAMHIHTKAFEREVIAFCADLFRAPADDRWGYVTSGGSEGNLYALHLARNLFPQAACYFSDAAHYSIDKSMRLLGMQPVRIRCDEHGEMSYDDLHSQIAQRRHQPAIVVATIGTTMSEAIDDTRRINAVLDHLAIRDRFIHADAALAGIPLGLLDPTTRPGMDFADGADAIAISGHKFLGSPTPCGNRRELHRMSVALRVAVVRSGSECRIDVIRGMPSSSVFTPPSPLDAGTLRLAGLIIWEVVVRGSRLAGAAELELVAGVIQLHPRDAMFEAMLRGWRAQQVARGLREDTIAPRERLVRRFLAFTNEYPWSWMPSHVDEWTLSLMSERHLAASTVRGYQTDLRLFSEYLADGRYGWAVECEKAFGTYPVPICHEWNTIAHLNDYEGSPQARPFARQEVQRFLDYADEQVERAVKARRKGALAAYRDATLFKVIYGWGLRRTEAAKLDLVDWGRNPAAAQYGRFGLLQVRYGKAVRGQPPRRRTVLSVMAWAVEAVADYVDNVRPRFGCADHPALWVTERGGRISPAEVNARFVGYRDALGLPSVLTPHSLRHSYVTHLTEDGVDRRFVQEQVGHRRDTSTAIYTHVSGEFMNTALRRALAPALTATTAGGLS